MRVLQHAHATADIMDQEVAHYVLQGTIAQVGIKKCNVKLIIIQPLALALVLVVGLIHHQAQVLQLVHVAGDII